MQPYVEPLSGAVSTRRPPRKGSLRGRIIGWSFVPTTVILVAVALVSLRGYAGLTETLVLDRDREMTRLSADVVAAELAAYTNPLSDQYLAVFDDVVAFGANGSVLSAEGQAYGQLPSAWLAEILSAPASQSGSILSNVVEDGPQGDKMIVAVIPSLGPAGQPAGGIAALFHLDPTAETPLLRSMANLRRGATETVYLVDAHGQVIAHSDPTRVGESFATLAAVQKVLGGEAGALRTRGVEGHEIVASYAPVPGTSWGLVSEENWATLIGASRRYGRLSLLLVALGVVVPTAIVAFGVRRITQPIRDLSQAAQRMARGHLNQRIGTSVGGELEELAEQFNRMSAQLEASYAHLEQKVADRTRELATLNTIATKVSRSLDLKEVMSDALSQVLEVMKMDRGQAFRLDEESGDLVLVAQQGFSGALNQGTGRLPLSACLAGQAAAEGRPVFRRFAACPPSEWKEMLRREGIQVVVSIPLLSKGKTVGAIDLQSKTPRAILAEELSLLSAIGHQIGLAVENASLYEQAQQLAIVRERNRLARDLHDSVTQALYGVTLCAEAASRQLSLGQPNRAAAHLGDIRMTTQQALREMRLLIFELRSPTLKRDGLVCALQSRLESVEQRAGLAAELHVTGTVQLLPELEAALYRVAQEALNNALKHAGASRVTVTLAQENGTVTLEVADDGQGFDPAAARNGGGFGLHSIEERVERLGGRLALDSKPGQGTRLRVEVTV